jgi:hypothetical protein
MMKKTRSFFKIFLNKLMGFGIGYISGYENTNRISTKAQYSSMVMNAPRLWRVFAASYLFDLAADSQLRLGFFIAKAN